MNPEQLDPSSSPSSALALSNIEEGMGHNAERAQELQEELAQRRASFHQNLAEAQALQGKETLLADIIDEEMAHWPQVSVWSHLHLQQAKKRLSHSLMRSGGYPLCLRNSRLSWSKSKSRRRIPEMIVPSTTHIKDLRRRHLVFYLVWWMPDELQH